MIRQGCTSFYRVHDRKVWSKVSITHHEIRDGRKQKDGDDAVGEEVGKNLGQEVDRCTVITAGVFMTMAHKHEDAETQALSTR